MFIFYTSSKYGSLTFKGFKSEIFQQKFTQVCLQ